MDDLSTLQSLLNLSEDDAWLVLDLCEVLRREDDVAAHGYPKDTPRGLALDERFSDGEFVERLLEVAQHEGLDEKIVHAIRRMKPT